MEKILSKRNFLSFENFREIIQTIRINGGEVILCPSLVGYQMNSLEKILGGVAGGIELFSFGISKLTVDIDFEAGTFRYVVANEMLRELEITVKKYTECCLARGLWLRRKITKLTAIEILQQLKSKEINAIIEEKESEFIQNGVNLIENPIFLNYDPPKLNFNQLSGIPNFITSKFHEKLYFAQCLFPLSTELVGAFIKKTEIMSNPIADSLKYRTLVHKYKPIMKKVYSTLNHCFEENTAHRGIKVYY